jgi:hypothetical protein
MDAIVRTGWRQKTKSCALDAYDRTARVKNEGHGWPAACSARVQARAAAAASDKA